MFRWAAEEELLPGSIYQNLRAVANLRAGRSQAREAPKVRPVPHEHIDAALPHMPPVVQAMVRFQLLTGCRPAEVCMVRPMDLDTTFPSCWVYRPGSDQGAHGAHKTAHHGCERLIFIGPKAQLALAPYLNSEAEAYCFSPGEAEVRRHSLRRASQGGALSPILERRSAKRRQRAPRGRYDTHSYRRAIARACQKADKQARSSAAPGLHTQVVIPTWGPNRLRHNRATELRRHGLDVAKTILGHTKVETTQIYAEKDMRAAMDLVAVIG